MNHTDGRETRHAPNAWFSALMAVDPVHGVRLLASTLARERGGVLDHGRRTDECIEESC